MTPAIAWVFRIRIAPSRIGGVVRPDFGVRRHSAEEMGFVVEQPLAAAKDFEGAKLVAEVRLGVEVKADARPLQPTAAATAPSADIRTVAPPGCKAITDSPVWAALALVAEAAVDSAEAEVVSVEV